jgi:sulfur-carrier protein
VTRLPFRARRNESVDESSVQASRLHYDKVMQITVHYFAQLKRAAGVAVDSVAVDASTTLAQLVTHLAGRHDGAFRSLVLDAAGLPQRSLLYAVGDDQAELDCVLRDGDVVTILAPMAGGLQ